MMCLLKTNHKINYVLYEIAKYHSIVNIKIKMEITLKCELYFYKVLGDLNTVG